LVVSKLESEAGVIFCLRFRGKGWLRDGHRDNYGFRLFNLATSRQRRGKIERFNVDYLDWLTDFAHGSSKMIGGEFGSPPLVYTQLGNFG
jgi:hypothetical protein